jgi:hypothetical protein
VVRWLLIATLVVAILAYAVLFLLFGGWWIFCFVPGAEC